MGIDQRDYPLTTQIQVVFIGQCIELLLIDCVYATDIVSGGIRPML